MLSEWSFGWPRRDGAERLAALGAAAVALALAACTANDGDERPPRAAGAGCPSAPAAPAVAPPPANEAAQRRILFWRETPWPSLWSVRADGTRLRRVYPTRQNAKRPRLSPDRRWISFDGASPGKPPITDFDVQIVRVDGSGRRTLAESTAWELDAAWSTDGKRLSFSRWRPRGEDDDWLRSQIWVVDVDGGPARRLGLGTAARWSPDGKRLVFSAPTPASDGDLFVMNADGTARCRLLATPALEQAADWSPDGRRILFTRFGPDGADVYSMNVDGTGVRNLTRAPGFDLASSWSPDGSKVLFTGPRPGAAEMFVVDADGSHARSLSRGRFRGSDPSWR